MRMWKQLDVESSKTPTTWVVDRTQQIATNNYNDYAIVARFTDSTTGKLAVVVAGVIISFVIGLIIGVIVGV